MQHLSVCDPSNHSVRTTKSRPSAAASSILRCRSPRGHTAPTLRPPSGCFHAAKTWMPHATCRGSSAGTTKRPARRIPTPGATMRPSPRPRFAQPGIFSRAIRATACSIPAMRCWHPHWAILTGCSSTGRASACSQSARAGLGSIPISGRCRFRGWRSARASVQLSSNRPALQYPCSVSARSANSRRSFRERG